MRVVVVVLACLVAGCMTPVPHGLTVPFGAPASGWLQAGESLPDRGPGFVRARPGEDTRWGTPDLVGAIVRAAASVREAWPGGAPLRVGDLAARYGGRHSRHRSHRTGRDADLIFYVTHLDGRSAEGRGFLAFDRFGIARDRRDDGTGDSYLFDTPRNWHLVRTLLADPQAHVQWLFCSWGVKQRLLEYAADVEPDASLLARAADVLHQPTGALPHDDHFHVRLACTARDRALGCLDRGPLWPWLRELNDKLPEASAPFDDDALVRWMIEEPAATEAAPRP